MLMRRKRPEKFFLYSSPTVARLSQQVPQECARSGESRHLLTPVAPAEMPRRPTHNLRYRERGGL
jgi:hypothetical protein